MNSQETIEKLGKLGFTYATQKIKNLAEKKRKLAIAYEHYRFVRQEKINDFNQKLKEKTIKRNGEYQVLSFSSLATYEEVPPEYVLLKLEEAMGKKCFDSFKIAHIVKVKDPILFGKIDGCTDLFYIDQWDDDVSIHDILNINEG